jgi:anhydro-N-acetylmuramic acid kinase
MDGGAPVRVRAAYCRRGQLIVFFLVFQPFLDGVRMDARKG